MNLPRLKNRLVLLLPWLLLGWGIWIVARSETEVRVQFERAQDYWRTGEHTASVELYRGIADHYTDSDYAPRALWEIGTIQYINLYQIDQASKTFQEIIDSYPNHLLAIDSLRRLAEIHEVDFQDSETAVGCWEQLLEKPLEPEARDEVLFRLGNSWFHLAELGLAQTVFDQLLESPTLSTYYRQEVTIRLGTIFQLREQHSEAIPFFEDALRAHDCAQCRLAAQLGLIESYEFLGDLATALRVAANIDEVAYSASSKQELLKRLQQKQRFFNPTTWTGTR